MSTKFEQLLDLIVNEEMDKANELFHSIVVEKSRDIYENLIAEEEAEEEPGENPEVEEGDETDEDPVEETMDLEDSYSMEADDEDDQMPVQDKTDDFSSDVDANDMDMGGEEPTEDSAIMDIKNAIEELEAAFAELEQAKGMGGDMGSDFGDQEEPTGGADDIGGSDDMMGKPAFEGRRMTREYVEKVGNDWEKNSQKTPGPVGSGKGDQAGQTSVDSGKSPVSSGKGKPTTGATAANIAKGGTGEGAMDGTSPNGKTGGLVKNPQDMKTGNGNVPGGSMGIKNLSKVTQNSKTAGPVGSGTGDKAGQTSGADQAKSPLNGAPNRNA